PSQMKAILCHNPTSGGGTHKKRDLMAALALAGIEARYVSTKGRSFPAALEEDADLIIAAGGDGTVGKVIKAMPNRKVPLAIVPLGTANNIARSLGIAGTPPHLAEGWRLDHWRPF